MDLDVKGCSDKVDSLEGSIGNDSGVVSRFYRSTDRQHLCAMSRLTDTPCDLEFFSVSDDRVWLWGSKDAAARLALFQGQSAAQRIVRARREMVKC